ncbi:MAG: RtcB family protein [Burkholderiales bacterium]
MATKPAIIPTAVGVDIGCGMIAARTSLTAAQLEERSLKRIFDQISRDVPVGREQRRDGREMALRWRRCKATLSAFSAVIRR